jgi:hypothetical protein
MIRVFNSAVAGERLIPLDEVNIVTQSINCYNSRPYILFEHKDYPLGALMAEYDGEYWQADMC